MRYPAKAVWASLLCLALASAPFALATARPLAPEHCIKVAHDATHGLAVAKIERTSRAHHSLSNLQLAVVFAPSTTPGPQLSSPLLTRDDGQLESSLLSSSNTTRAPPQFTSTSE